MIATSATTGCATRSQHLRERAAGPCDAIEGGAMMLVLRLAFPLLIIALFFCVECAFGGRTNRDRERPCRQRAGRRKTSRPRSGARFAQGAIGEHCADR